MITAHNFKQTILAFVGMVIGILGFAVAFYFFRFAFGVATDAFGSEGIGRYSSAFAVVMLMIIACSGLLRWRNGNGLYGYAESSLFISLDPVSGGAVATDRFAHQITGPAYILTQIFLMGPLQLLTAWERMRSLIRPDPELEARLSELLARLRAKNKWEGPFHYPGEERELALLIRVGKLDFSRTKLRFRARD